MSNRFLSLKKSITVICAFWPIGLLTESLYGSLEIGQVVVVFVRRIYESINNDLEEEERENLRVYMVFVTQWYGTEKNITPENNTKKYQIVIYSLFLLGKKYEQIQ